MDVFGLLDTPGWFLIALIFISSVYLYFTWNHGYWDTQHVKVSATMDPLFSWFFRILSKPLYHLDAEDYKRNEKVWGTYEGRTAVLMVADLELIKVLTIKNFQQFMDRRLLTDCAKSRISGQLLTSLKGENWMDARAILSPIFTSGKLKQLSNLMDECSQVLTRGLRETAKTGMKDIDISEKILSYVLDVIATCCFGSKISNDQVTKDQIVSHAKTLLTKKTTCRALLQRFFPRIYRLLGISFMDEKSLAFFQRTVNQIVGMRKQEKIKRNDFLQLLLDGQAKEIKGLADDDICLEKYPRDHYVIDSKDFELPRPTAPDKKVLSDDSILSNSVIFYTAGFETIANTISFAVFLLATNIRCQEKLTEEIDACLEASGNLHLDSIMKLRYLDKVISETLRLYPAVTRIERVAAEDCKFGGIVLREGMVVAVPIYAIHHDELYYPDPEKFDPERFSDENVATRNQFSYLPFGAGPRNCIGVRFALMTIKIALVHLFREFQASPSEKTEVPLQLKRAVHLIVPKNGVHVKMIPRKPTSTSEL